MAMENFPLFMVLNTLDSSAMVSSREKAWWNIQMEANTKVNSKQEKDMALEFLQTGTKHITKVNSKMVIVMA